MKPEDFDQGIGQGRNVQRQPRKLDPWMVLAIVLAVASSALVLAVFHIAKGATP